MFRSYFENNGTTQKWRDLYHGLNAKQKDRLMKLTSLTVTELLKVEWPNDLKSVLKFYIIKYNGKKENTNDYYGYTL